MTAASIVTAGPSFQATLLEVRFCPADSVWTYPLDELHGVQGMLLQNAVIVNHGTTFRVTGVDLELLDNGRVEDVRHLDSTDVRDLGAAARQLNPLVRSFAFQFCGRQMLDTNVTLAGPELRRDEALIVLQEPFAFTGRRDALRITAYGEQSGHAARVRNTIRVVSGFPQGNFAFPLSGVWYIDNGPSFHTPHRWGVSEEFAFDIVKLDAQGSSHRGAGTQFEDYYAYNAPVRAMARGRVVAAVNSEPEAVDAMMRPSETRAAYAERLQRVQAARIARGARGLMGDYVVVDHGGNRFSLYAHLKPGSVTVHVNDIVTANEVIGRLGSSGNSTEPHLHLQLCREADPVRCDALPLHFANVTLPRSDQPRALEAGDFVRAP